MLRGILTYGARLSVPDSRLATLLGSRSRNQLSHDVDTHIITNKFDKELQLRRM
jgi:hypothetical protein